MDPARSRVNLIFPVVQKNCPAMIGVNPYIGRSMTDTIYSVPFKARTQALLRHASKSIKQGEIARAVGLSDAWISRFKHDRAYRFEVDDVQRLHDYLIGLRL